LVVGDGFGEDVLEEQLQQDRDGYVDIGCQFLRAALDEHIDRVVAEQIVPFFRLLQKGVEVVDYVDDKDTPFVLLAILSLSLVLHLPALLVENEVEIVNLVLELVGRECLYEGTDFHGGIDRLVMAGDDLVQLIEDVGNLSILYFLHEQLLFVHEIFALFEKGTMQSGMERGFLEVVQVEVPELFDVVLLLSVAQLIGLDSLVLLL
jgi:hypothetical protein